MKEKPILFSGDMVRAILAGKKTQTRRAMQLPVIQQTLEILDIVEHGDEWLLKVRDENLFVAHLGDQKLRLRSPYGKPGDRLWVRESIWQEREGCTMPSGEYMDSWRNKGAVAYMAEHPERNWGDTSLPWGKMASRPSIHMPRFASRITMEVTAVRVERLQDISAEDAIKEGAFQQGKVGDDPVADLWTMTGKGWRYNSAKEAYASYWDELNAKRSGCLWSDNPWVWCVEFKRVDD